MGRLVCQLQEFHKNNGHCTKSSRKPETKALSSWLQKQRNRLADRDDKTVSNDQRRRLFEWRVAPSKYLLLKQMGALQDQPKLSVNERWEVYYQQLLDFRSEYGHCKFFLTRVN